MSQDNKKFTFFIPAMFEKGTDKNGKEIYKVKGVCSTIDRDLDKQILHPTGFDFRPLMKSGFINYNHRWKDNPSAIIGEPTLARVQSNGEEFYIEGYLYSDSKKAKEVIELNNTLLNGSESRRLGWSIEGYAVETHPTDPSIITRAVITGVAITPNPKNPKTLVSILKGQGSEDDDDEEEDEDEDNDEFLKKTLESNNVDKKSVDEIEKMDTGSMPMVESVDGGHKKTKEVDEMRAANLYGNATNCAILKKSQVFDKIFETFPDSTEEVYEKVYNFITLNEKQMKSETILKSLSELQGYGLGLEEQEEEDLIEKGIKSDDDDDEDDDDEDDQDNEDDDGPTEDDEKNAMKEIAKGQHSEGMDSYQMVENLVKIGFGLKPSMDTVEQVIKEAQTKPNGGDIKEVHAPIVKGVDFDELTFGFIEALTPKFAAVGNLMKHQVELLNGQSELIKSQQAELVTLRGQTESLSTSVQHLESSIAEIAKAPIVKKSLVKGQAPGFIGRFDEDEVPANGKSVRTFRFTGAQSSDIDNLLDMASDKCHQLRKSGHPSGGLEIGVQELEISKMIVSPQAKQAIREHLQIEIV